MTSFDIKALEKCFKQPKIRNSFESLYHCLGFITATSSSPDVIQPSEWMEQLVKAENKVPEFDSEEQVKTMTSSLITWWDQCNQLFDQGGTIVLPAKLGLTAGGKPNKALIEFASGYLDAFDWLFETWRALLPDEKEEENRTLSILNFILARFVNERMMMKNEPELYQQLPDTEGCFKVLPNLISGVGMLGQDLATEFEEQQIFMEENPIDEESLKAIEDMPFINVDRTVGRNDPCPCGSGKKFKKCCLH